MDYRKEMWLIKTLWLEKSLSAKKEDVFPRALPHVGLGGAENTAVGGLCRMQPTCFVSFID